MRTILAQSLISVSISQQSSHFQMSHAILDFLICFHLNISIDILPNPSVVDMPPNIFVTGTNTFIIH